MTWGEIRLLSTKTGETVDLDSIDGYIRARYTTILDFKKWKALDVGAVLTLVAGTAGTPAIYKLPANLKVLLEVNNTSANFPLRPNTQAELNLLFPGRPDVGQPLRYSMAQDSNDTPPLHQVEVYPIPNSAAAGSMPYRYTSIPPSFGTDTTASPLPWIPPHIIINGVRADISAFLEKFDAAKFHEGKFSEGLAELAVVQPWHKETGER